MSSKRYVRVTSFGRIAGRRGLIFRCAFLSLQRLGLVVEDLFRHSTVGLPSRLPSAIQSKRLGAEALRRSSIEGSVFGHRAALAPSSGKRSFLKRAPHFISGNEALNTPPSRGDDLRKVEG